VGGSVGALYCVNTFGSAMACFCAAVFLMRSLGEAGSVHLASSFNIAVGLLAVIASFRIVAVPRISIDAKSASGTITIPLPVGVLLAGSIGFIALAYEIIWYRLYSFASGGKASSFALLLAFYLCGIAAGSAVVESACRGSLANDLPRTLKATASVVLLGTIIAFLIGPTLAFTIAHAPFWITYFLILLAAGLIGAAFPLLAHAAIGPHSNAGKNISLLYLSNIVGSALGSFLVGFIVMNYWSTKTTSIFLLLLGVGIFAAIVLQINPAPPKRFIYVGLAACIGLMMAAPKLYVRMYERLLTEKGYDSSRPPDEMMENRSGVINVRYDGTVFGGGVYDGRFSTSLVNDTNGLFRAFAICGMHEAPSRMLIIGLASGSWAQVEANDPRVKDITIVEINPGYLPLIQEREEVKSLLKNPKVHIVIDDGRRWLISHPQEKFDFVLMNTTYNWRANATNILSKEFLEIVRLHLKRNGIGYYNTTWSEEVMATGAAVFPYTLRIANFLAVSDSPISIDQSRWKEALTHYAIEGKPVFDLTKPYDRMRLEEVLKTTEKSSDPHSLNEDRAHMVNRLSGTPIITDDNMGTEWK
jgi:spermidine synthase